LSFIDAIAHARKVSAPMCLPFALPNCAAVHCPLTSLINACAHSSMWRIWGTSTTWVMYRKQEGKFSIDGERWEDKCQSGWGWFKNTHVGSPFPTAARSQATREKG
jgi:hypothetical protein